MKKGLLLALCVLLGTFNAQAEKKFTMISTNCNSIGTGMSSNGKYVVGVDPTPVEYGVEIMSGFKSYLWDADAKTLTWITEADQVNPGKTGYFTDETDDKIISGYFKDPDYPITVTEWEGDVTLPVNVAAIWKDGNVTSLGIGDFDLSIFNNFNDGSYATAISNDGKTVVGFVAVGNFAYSYPCMWKYDDANRKWNFTRCKYPSDAKGGQVLAVSDDGGVAVGAIYYQNRDVAAFWKNGEYTIIEGIKNMIDDDTKYNEDYNKNCAYGVSPNGQYISFNFNDNLPCMYFTNENRYVKLGAYKDVTGLDVPAISNNGDIFGCYKYGNYWTEQYTRPFWYSLNTLREVGLDYFIYLYTPEIEIPLSFTFEHKVTSNPHAVSADGKIIMGNNMTEYNKYETWVLQTEAEYTIIPEDVQNIKAKVTDLEQITVTWDKVPYAPFQYVLKSYNVYCDGNLVGNVEAKSDGDGSGDGDGGIEPLKYSASNTTTESFVHNNVNAGYHKYSVTSVFQKEEGTEMREAPKSNPIEVCLAKTFEMPFFDNFDTGAIESNYWTIEDLMENPTQFYWGAGMYLGINSSFALNVAVTTDGKPYSNALVSRPLDARKLDNVYISYTKRYLFANSEDWDLTGDTLSVEVSNDGDTWIPVKAYALDTEEAGVWNFESINVTKQVAHTLFQVRLHVHGKGLAQLLWYFDLFKVGNKAENEAPEDLTGKVESDKVSLIWKNTINAYELNYLDNPYGWEVFNLAIGDEGKTFIAANSFEPDDLALFNEKYLTSIKAFINHDTSIEDSKDTHASVVVYENGTLIREQEIDAIKYNQENLVILKEPVKIDVTKELKIGLKIFNYDERQIPITYHNTRNFIAGKSDLYSQDEGRTWKRLSDFYSTVEGHELDGYCCWEITGNVTDESTVSPDIAMDNNLMAYNVFRNGEKINSRLVYYLQPRYIDTTPIDNGCYEVVAYYLDGSISDYSVQYCIGELPPSSIDDHTNNSNWAIYPNPATDCINIPGDFNQAMLLNINGQVVLSTTEAIISVSSLPAGVYFLKIENGDAIHTEKVMIKR